MLPTTLLPAPLLLQGLAPDARLARDLPLPPDRDREISLLRTELPQDLPRARCLDREISLLCTELPQDLPGARCLDAECAPEM